MELEDTSVSMTDDQAQVLEGAIEIYKAKVKRIRGANFAKELKKRVENETVWEKAKAWKEACGIRHEEQQESTNAASGLR